MAFVEPGKYVYPSLLSANALASFVGGDLGRTTRVVRNRFETCPTVCGCPVAGTRRSASSDESPPKKNPETFSESCVQRCDENIACNAVIRWYTGSCSASSSGHHGSRLVRNINQPRNRLQSQSENGDAVVGF